MGVFCVFFFSWLLTNQSFFFMSSLRWFWFRTFYESRTCIIWDQHTLNIGIYMQETQLIPFSITFASQLSLV